MNSRKTLNCAIKKQYLDMILQGAKKTEYRDMSDYWCGKIIDMGQYPGKTLQEVIDMLKMGKVELKAKPYTHITFHCNGQHETYEIKDIKTYRGHSLFAIRLGKKATTL